jgi:CRP-like cAMP-binding protein
MPPSSLADREARHAAGEHLFHLRDKTVNQVHVIVSGQVKLYQCGPHGDSRVIGFRGPGDWLGLDAIGLPARPTAAVALTVCETAVLAYPALATLLARQPRSAEAFTRLLAAELARDQRHAAMLRGTSAAQRVAIFLQQCVVQRAPPQTATAIGLPMSRDDIASYLGLTPATLSRVLSKLRRRGWLTLGRRGTALIAHDDIEQVAAGGAL